MPKRLHKNEIRDILHICGIWRLLEDNENIVSDIKDLQFSYEDLLEDIQTRDGRIEKIFQENEEKPEHFYLLSTFLIKIENLYLKIGRKFRNSGRKTTRKKKNERKTGAMEEKQDKGCC